MCQVLWSGAARIQPSFTYKDVFSRVPCSTMSVPYARRLKDFSTLATDYLGSLENHALKRYNIVNIMSLLEQRR